MALRFNLAHPLCRDFHIANFRPVGGLKVKTYGLRNAVADKILDFTEKHIAELLLF